MFIFLLLKGIHYFGQKRNFSVSIWKSGDARSCRRSEFKHSRGTARAKDSCGTFPLLLGYVASRGEMVSGCVRTSTDQSRVSHEPSPFWSLPKGYRSLGLGGLCLVGLVFGLLLDGGFS